jgi:hypothetical protein
MVATRKIMKKKPSSRMNAGVAEKRPVAQLSADSD